MLENLERVTGGALDFGGARDDVDLAGERAAIAFTHGGRAHALDFVYHESFADPALLTYLVGLAEASGAERRLTGYSDGGAGLVIG